MASSIPNLVGILLRNAAPSALERALLQRALATIMAQKEQLYPEHIGLEDQAVRYIEAALSSPVRQVPVELLAEIFTLVFPSGRRRLGYSGRSQLVNLQLVCRTWRDTALATRSLWSGVIVEATIYRVRRVSLQRIGSWLSRSGTAPKTLAFETYHDLEEETDRCPECRVLGASFARFFAQGLVLDHFEFACDRPQCVRALLDALKPESRQSWDAIRSIALRIVHVWNEPFDLQQSMFQRLPSSATSLELSLPAGLEDFGDEAPELHLPSQVLERLTTLDIECDWCDPAVLPQLKHCINVETLAIELSEVIIPETDEPVVFPQVRNLHLKYVAADSESQMLKFIKAPKMVNLEVRYRDSDDYVKRGLANPLLAFIKQSGCETTLRSLSLRDVDARVREMVKILVGLPSLTSLKLQRVSSTEDPEDYLFEQLTTRDAKGETQRTLPSLEDLELVHFDPEEVPSLLGYLKSRRPYRLEGGQPVFDGPPDTIQNVIIEYSRRGAGTRLEFDSSEEVQVLRRWGGVYVGIVRPTNLSLDDFF